MGSIFVDDLERPHSAMAFLGNFCFLAGEPLAELALYKPADSLAVGYSMQMIDERLFQECKDNGWSRDLVSQYADYEMYQQLGLGVVVLKDEEIVAGASSYAGYKSGIEVEIDTKREYRFEGSTIWLVMKKIPGRKLLKQQAMM